MRALTRLLLAAALVSPAVAAGEGWIEDFDDAAAVAKKEGKNLLVDFTGSDWCGWCIKLHDEVFQHDEFLTYAREHYVLVSLDFPKREPAKSRVPDPARNEELRGRYDVSGFPTVLLMTPDGAVFARTGYQAGGPKAYVEHLRDITEQPLADMEAIDRLAVAYEASDRGEGAFDVLLAGLDGDAGASPFAARVESLVREHLGRGDEMRRARIVRALIRMSRIDDAVLAEASVVDPRNAQGLWSDALVGKLDEVTEEDQIRPAAEQIRRFFETEGLQNLDRESTVMLLAYGAYWNSKFLDDPEAAKRLARLGLENTTEQHRAHSLFQRILGE